MKKLLSATVFILATLLTGCTSIAPSLDFSLETSQLRSLQGSIINDVYTTQFNHQPFSIEIPQKYNRYELPVLLAREKHTKQYTFVSFGPAPSDKTVYRVMVFKKCQEPLWLFKARTFPLLVNVAAKGYDRHMIPIYHHNTYVNSRPALFDVYVQSVPGVYQYVDIKEPSYVTLTHAIYYVDYGNYGVIFWVQANSDSGMFPVTKRNRNQVINETWVPAVQFLRSFVMNQCGCRK